MGLNRAAPNQAWLGGSMTGAQGESDRESVEAEEGRYWLAVAYSLEGLLVTGRRLVSILKAWGISRLRSCFACEGRHGVRPPRCNDPLVKSIQPWRSPDSRDEMKGSESTTEGGWTGQSFNLFGFIRKARIRTVSTKDSWHEHSLRECAWGLRPGRVGHARCRRIGALPSPQPRAFRGECPAWRTSAVAPHRARGQAMRGGRPGQIQARPKETDLTGTGL